MNKSRYIYGLTLMLLSFLGRGQDVANNQLNEFSYKDAQELAYEGKHAKANIILSKVTAENPNNLQAQWLLAKTHTWKQQYAKARLAFNKITNIAPNNTEFWIAAIKNELYANENYIALGLANKALVFIEDNKEIVRLQQLAKERIENTKHPNLGWFNTNQKVSTKHQKLKITKLIENEVGEEKSETKEKAFGDNSIGTNSSYTVFSERFDPVFFSNISYKHQTKFGSIIPKVNYNNRAGNNGLQYEIDLYPKFLKRFYAYLNYGYSKASIYPQHKAGGDVYVSLPGAFEFSAGGRYTVTSTRNVASVTNSFGHYRGNYYFSLRSFITPRPESLTRFSANFLTRKYLKDAENYMGISVGVGYSPELRQTIAGDVLLAETLLFIESQRLSLEYQFTSKDSKNVYKAAIGVRRQELSFDSNNFFWGITAGLNYKVKL